MRWKYFFLFLFSFFLWSACSDDDEDTPTGCKIDDFLGPWDIAEQCGVSDSQYVLTITKLASGIRLTNLGGQPDYVVDASVSGSSFTIAPQTVPGSTISGNGSLNAGCAQITISWQGPNGNCAGTGTK